MSYQRKPFVFEAIRWDGQPSTMGVLAQWAQASGQALQALPDVLLIETREGLNGCIPGNWFVKSDDGSVYPILDRRFRHLYESVEGSNTLFRRRSLVFEAIHWSDLPGIHETLFRWLKASGQSHRYEVNTGIMHITIREGSVSCKPGDWFVKSDTGEVYPVPDFRFRHLYEEVV